MARDYIGQPWIGVDLDGTLAYYDGWKGIEHIGEPIPEMIERVKRWLEEGKEVRIFTARVSNGAAAVWYVEDWCIKYIGKALPITNVKDPSMIELWDDRCVQVVPNEGVTVQENLLGYIAESFGCPYRHFTDLFYKHSRDPNLPDWYFKLCGGESNFTCQKTDEIIKNCWARFFEED